MSMNTEDDIRSGFASSANGEESTPTTGRKAEMFENDKLFVEGISTATSKEDLKNYLEKISGLRVKDIIYGSGSTDSVDADETFYRIVAELNPENSSEECYSTTSDVQWTKSSIKHRSKISEFVKLLKTNPSRVTKIGTYRVCFDDKFSIGEGSDGTKVYVGLSDDGFEVAVKCMDQEKCQQMGVNEKMILNCPKIRNEKHIVNYRFFVQPQGSKTAHLVLDLHEESLRDYVKNEERSIEQLQREGPRIVRQILYGVRALHSCNPEILHRDLRPTNILVSVEGEMMIADFGMSRRLPERAKTLKSRFHGAEDWVAFESLPKEDDDDDNIDIQVNYKTESDIQVVGMLFYYVLTKGKHPYGTRNHRTSNIANGSFNLKDLRDACAKDLITWMLQHDVRKRPNVHKCLKHPYLQTAEKNFKFLTCVGNEKEIKVNDATSIVVQELNELSAFKDWLLMIENWVMKFMQTRRGKPYTKDVADLLRFMRNLYTHWDDKPPPTDVQNTVSKPQEYCESRFPTLAVEVHRVIREHPDWTSRDKLQEYF